MKTRKTLAESVRKIMEEIYRTSAGLEWKEGLAARRMVVADSGMTKDQLLAAARGCSLEAKRFVSWGLHGI